MIINDDDIKNTFSRFYGKKIPDHINEIMKTPQFSWFIYNFCMYCLESRLLDLESFLLPRHSFYIQIQSGIFKTLIQKTNIPELEEVIRRDSFYKRWYEGQAGYKI